MIISVSRRTDIPAFYSEWFHHRIEAGYCLTPHPFNRNKIYEISLAPEDVDALVFWTKNPAPMFPLLPELDQRGFQYYFLYTLNHYPAPLEPNLPPLDDRLAAFETLSRTIGLHRVIWRYDPIIISNRTGPEYHRRVFSRLCQDLQGLTNKVITSVLSPYAKTRRRLTALETQGFVFDWTAGDSPNLPPLLRDLEAQARRCGMQLTLCAPTGPVKDSGLPLGACIDGDLINRLKSTDSFFRPDLGQRDTCRCVVSKDIGINDTCLHHCPYCYATVSEKAAEANHARHDPASPLLVGCPAPHLPGRDKDQPRLFR